MTTNVLMLQAGGLCRKMIFVLIMLFVAALITVRASRQTHASVPQGGQV